MDQISFNLTKINTLQFAIIEDAFNAEIDKYNIETNLGYGIDSKNSSILSMVKIQFRQKNIPFLIIEVSCEFDVDKDFWKEFDRKKSITIPKEFMGNLAMITVGTTRGVLHEKIKDTNFNDFVLPTINVAKMIKKDGEFDK